jgi:hypothetical protein
MPASFNLTSEAGPAAWTKFFKKIAVRRWGRRASDRFIDVRLYHDAVEAASALIRQRGEHKCKGQSGSAKE